MGYSVVQSLLNNRAECQAKITVIGFDGSLEIKEIKGEKYIYARKREAGRNTSTYLDVYSDVKYNALMKQAQELRELKKRVREIERQLLHLGYVEGKLSKKVLLNIDFARANVKALIYDQAVLEGVSTTFPQTETILENGIVSGVRVQDVQKILNLKHAWEFILDKDVVASETNYYLLSYIARLVNEGFYVKGGSIRTVPVSIGGTSFMPPFPIESDVKEKVEEIIRGKGSVIQKAIRLCLYCMKTQIFIDGNKRATVIFVNHFLIKNGGGLLVVPEKKVEEFRTLLISYYEGKRKREIVSFLKEYCWRRM